MLEYHKEYYYNKKEQISETNKLRIKCECGCELTKCNLTKHLKSNKHKQLLLEQKAMSEPDPEINYD